MNVLIFSPAQWCGLGSRGAGEMKVLWNSELQRAEQVARKSREKLLSLKCPSARAFGFHEGYNDSCP